MHRPTLAWSATVASAAGAALARARSLRWGATDEELAAVLPGDELIAHPNLVATRAITIDATADRVWPWLAQLGQGRGGLYSYDALENLVGCDMHSADRIVPEWQHVEVGSQVRLHPDIGLVVARVDPGRALVLHGAATTDQGAPPYDFSWAFVLRVTSGRRTRLLVRERYGYTRWWAPLLVEPVELVSLVMSRRMLRGIRDRAERTPS